MLWTNSKRVALLVEGDVCRVRENALVVITLDQRNKLRVDYRRGRSGLSVIAVIGPGSFGGCNYNEAVLLEVGVSRGRPYAAANKTKGSYRAGESRQIPKRRKWFWPTLEQYTAVAPEIFRIIRELTKARMANWQCGTPENPRKILTSVSSFSHRRKKVETRRAYVEVTNGIRFSIPYTDQYLMADVLWAEWELSPLAKEKIPKMARFLGLLMSRYKLSRRTSHGFWKQHNAAIAKASIDRLLIHERVRLLAELMRKGEGKKHRPVRFCLDRILEAIGEPSPIFSRAIENVLPNQAERIGDTYLRMVRHNGRYSTIEVHQQPIQKPKPTSRTWLPKGEQEEVPF